MITVRQADLARADDQRTVLALLDAYSRDSFGDKAPLSEYARANLIAGLRAHATTFIALAFVEDQPAGIAVCFGGFSTFAAKPLLNIHDLSVLPEFRGRGVSRRLLDFLEAHARAASCCKLTLEVLEVNARARGVYEAAGFATPVYAGKKTVSLFLTKAL